MRGCLLTLLALAAIVAAVVWFALPPLAGTLVQGALVAGGINADSTVVTVRADPPPRLLSLSADSIEIRATNATFHGVSAAALELTLHDVDLVARTVGSIEGTLYGVRLPDAVGDDPGLPLVMLSGTPDAVRATITLDAADATSLGTSAVERALGITPSAVRLKAPDRVTIDVGGQSIAGRLAVRDGSLVVMPPAGSGLEPIDIVSGGGDLGLRVLSFRVVAGGIVLVATFRVGFG